ncbi:MAG: FYDLN acid domain-containing protein, partial [Pacificimonas sp.]
MAAAAKKQADWGTKRTCPECNTRFYDLGEDDPATCVECGHEWVPEPVLKAKQPLPFDTA